MVYHKNINIFKDLNNPDILYTLGFFAADGTISDNKLAISVSSSDEDILYKIRDVFESDSPIRKISAKTNNHGYRSKELSLLSICSTEICHDLNRLGFYRAKTYKGFSLPKVSNSLLWHFIRGYFDGDGSFHYRSEFRVDNPKYLNTVYKFSLCSKMDTCLIEIRKFFLNYGISSSIYFCKNKKVFYLDANGNNNTYNIYRYMYLDANIFLNRKKKIFDDAPFKKTIFGVYSHKNKFKAVLKYKKHDIFLGLFENKEVASEIRDMVSVFLYGNCARLNDETNRLIDVNVDLLELSSRVKTLLKYIKNEENSVSE